MEKAEKELQHKERKIEQYEEKLTTKEERLEEKMEKMEEKKEEYMNLKIELEKVYDKQKSILSDLAKLSPEDAKQQLFEQIEIQEKEEIARFVNKYKQIKEEEAKEEGAKIIAKVLPRVAQE